VVAPGQRQPDSLYPGPVADDLDIALQHGVAQLGVLVATGLDLERGLGLGLEVPDLLRLAVRPGGKALVFSTTYHSGIRCGRPPRPVVAHVTPAPHQGTGGGPHRSMVICERFRAIGSSSPRRVSEGLRCRGGASMPRRGRDRPRGPRVISSWHPRSTCAQGAGAARRRRPCPSAGRPRPSPGRAPREAALRLAKGIRRPRRSDAM
jgi:hypothetical protein